MDRRRFISTDDFGYEEEGSPLLDALILILTDLVTPIFAEVYPELEDIEISGVNDAAGNTVMFEISGYVSSPLKPDVQRDFDPIITEFAGKKQQILNGLRWAIYPTMKEELLDKYDLSAEQFLIKTERLEVLPQLSAIYSTDQALLDPSYAGRTLFIVSVVFYLSIEDLSTLEPEGEEVIRLRYNNLCTTNSRYSEQELRRWALDLSIPGAGDMSRLQLCDAVKEYYGWL